MTLISQWRDVIAFGLREDRGGLVCMSFFAALVALAWIGSPA